jgi:hypothetical protein
LTELWSVYPGNDAGSFASALTHIDHYLRFGSKDDIRNLFSQATPAIPSELPQDHKSIIRT